MSASKSESPPDGATAGATPIDAVFFDFGGVFIDSPFAVVEERLADLGVDPVIALDCVFGPYDDDTDHPWHRLERGEITLDAARSEIHGLSLDRLGSLLDPMDLMARMAGGGGPRDWMVDGVRALRDVGIRTAVVTNNAREFAPFWRPILPLDELFDHVIDSSEVGVRKPDPRIFLLAVERMGVEPSRSLFIDDYDGNVIGARAVGLEAICCGYTAQTAQQALADLLTRCLPLNRPT